MPRLVAVSGFQRRIRRARASSSLSPHRSEFAILGRCRSTGLRHPPAQYLPVFERVLVLRAFLFRLQTLARFWPNQAMTSAPSTRLKSEAATMNTMTKHSRQLRLRQHFPHIIADCRRFRSTREVQYARGHAASRPASRWLTIADLHANNAR
jgi:hypothetical protein